MPQFYMILARKVIKIPEFCIIFARKINKIPEFYMIFAPKMPEFYIIIARKYFSRFFFLGGGHVPSLPPVSYAYALWCGPYLGGSAHEAQFPRDNLLLAAGENPRDAVRLGDQRAVDERERHAGQEAGGGASRRRRLSYQRECGGVGERQADEDDVAEFSRGGLDYRGVVVLPEHCRDAGSSHQSEAGQRHGRDDEPVRPA